MGGKFLPDGSILLPDGTRILPDGTRILPNGTCVALFSINLVALQVFMSLSMYLML
jgi:hypothetical protein